jgi:hypothetical protein
MSIIILAIGLYAGFRLGARYSTFTNLKDRVRDKFKEWTK